ncbi:HAAS signaling domain-containing protein [Streptomyces sp. NPDC048639]|uniref:HAAS signaling domain-containing protein n=1 Tax=Streptomyces sp. NPDC048639 TaxID=3365581 RepID=UPI0037222442
MTHDIRPSARAENYLAELERAAAALPPNRRAELLTDVRSHIDVAQAEARADSAAGTDDDAAVRTILNHLGDPQEIVAAALSDLPAAAESDLPAVAKADGAPRTASAAREAAALILLILGGMLFWVFPVVPQVGWFVGLVLLCLSRRWTVGDKLIGAAGIALPPLLLTGGMLFATSTTSCSDETAQAPLPGSPGGNVDTQSTLECTTSGGMPDPLANGLMVALLAVLVYATIRLARRAHRP